MEGKQSLEPPKGIQYQTAKVRTNGQPGEIYTSLRMKNEVDARIL